VEEEIAESHWMNLRKAEDISIYIYIYIYIYMYIYTYTHTHTHTHIHIHIHTVLLKSRCALRLLYVDLVVSIEVAIEVCCCFTVLSC
jgi:hypothetical protein